MSANRSAIHIISDILCQLRSIADKPISDIDKDDPFQLPRFISAGDSSIIINRNISDLIYELSQAVTHARPSDEKSISRKDWADIVQRVLGPILGRTDLNVSSGESANGIFDELVRTLRRSNWNFHPRTFLFGCSFVQTKSADPFQIGPVEIWPREEWLIYAFENGDVSATSKRRLVRRWGGEKLRKRRPSLDASNEDDIAKVIGKASYVAVVKTNGLLGEVAKQQALIAARLALLGVSLIWARPSRVLKEFNLLYDGPPHIRNYLFFQDRPEILSGSQWVKGQWGQPLFGEIWDTVVTEKADWWRVMSELLGFLVNTKDQSYRPELLSRLAQAMLWFYEACREDYDMKAVAKYMACLDALSGGQRAAGIVNFITVRLGVGKADTIRKDGPTFSEKLIELYGQGRSAIFHGNTNRFGDDWSAERSEAEFFSRLGLVVAFDWIANNPRATNIKAMSKAIR